MRLDSSTIFSLSAQRKNVHNHSYAQHEISGIRKQVCNQSLPSNLLFLRFTQQNLKMSKFEKQNISSVHPSELNESDFSLRVRICSDVAAVSAA